MKFEIQTTNNAFGLRFWEGILAKEDSKVSLCIRLSDMKEIGVAKTMNSSRKVETWLNSAEGQTWIVERLKNVTHTGFGSFL